MQHMLKLGFRVLLIGPALMWAVTAMAQKTAKPIGTGLAEKVAQAEKFMNQRMYPQARPILEDVLKTDSSQTRAYVLLGNIAFIDRIYSKAQQYYMQYLKRVGTKGQDEIALRTLNLMHEAGQYDAAIALARQLAADSASKPQYKWAQFADWRKLVFAADAVKRPNSKEPELMGPPLNALPLQYLPSLSPDETQFYFTGRLGQSATSDENIYMLEKTGNSWGSPKSVGDAVNSPYNEAACTISGDGNTMVFTVCESPKSTTGCDLYISRRQPDGTWGRPVNLDVVNSRFWDTQPCLSPDGNELFFISARPGGQGKSDIWYARTNELGEWTSPINLGPSVNTVEDEGAPQLHSNGKTLFFSSKGHAGLGGFDLFLAERDLQGVWARPMNLGYPLNTHHHESALFVNASGTLGYMTRDTKEPPTSHIWQWTVPAWITSKVSCAILKGQVLDAKTGKPVAAELWASPPDAKGQVYCISTSAQSGKFCLVLPATKTYEVHVAAKGYVFQSFSTNGLDRRPPERTIKLSPLDKEQTVVLGHLYFPTNGFVPLPESEAELRFLTRYAKMNVRTRITIAGHTDDVGDAAANQTLSEKRASTVVEYLQKQGIFPARLMAKGFGKSQPVAPNTSEKNRALNRRITMTIVPI